MATLFTTVLNGIEDNNETNDADFSTWMSAEHAISVYRENFKGECSNEEMEHTVRALNMIIESNGAKYQDAVEQWNLAIWGKNFANNNGYVAFSG